MMLQRQDICIQTLISNHGGEYTSKDFWDYLAQKGTRHKLMVHDTPEQHGIAKWLNQTFGWKDKCYVTGIKPTKEPMGLCYIACQLHQNSNAYMQLTRQDTLWDGLW